MVAAVVAFFAATAAFVTQRKGPGSIFVEGIGEGEEEWEVAEDARELSSSTQQPAFSLRWVRRHMGIRGCTSCIRHAALWNCFPVVLVDVDCDRALGLSPILAF
jgi:hypothetical protein